MRTLRSPRKRTIEAHPDLLNCGNTATAPGGQVFNRWATQWECPLCPATFKLKRDCSHHIATKHGKTSPR